MKRVVVTGMGIYSCIGKNKVEVCESLRMGRSGIGIDPLRIDYGYRSPSRRRQASKIERHS